MGILSWLSGKKTAPAAPSAAEAEAPSSAGSPGSPGPEAEPRVPLEELAAGLSSRNGGVRVDAARELLERWRGGESAAAEILAPRIGELLEDGEPLLRMTGLQAVRTLRKQENLEKHQSAVLALLVDPAAQVRTSAIWVALRLPGDVARAQVRALLATDDETMRFTAACALAEKNDSAALPELSAALHDDHRRQEALSALMTLGDAAAVAPVGALFEDEGLGELDRTMIAAALARFGDERGKAHLVARIEATGDDRPIAAEWAGRLGVSQAIAPLEELAGEVGDPARGAALRALGRLRAPGAEERLLALLRDAGADEDLRMDAAEGLAELGTPEALLALREGAGAEGELGPLCKELLGEIEQNDAIAQAAQAAVDAEAAAALTAAVVPDGSAKD